MARSEDVNILIKAKNQASGAIREAKADLSSLGDAGGALGGPGGLGGLLAGGALAFGLASIADAAIGAAGAVAGFAREAAGVAALRTAFEGLASGAGQSADAMLGAMRSASQGMISDGELMLSANKAMMLGVADSAEEMASLLEVAAVRGKAMGLSTAQAFSDLVTGIGRMSPLILDNLGIVTGGEAVFDAYAASIGRTADSLSDAEKKQALLNKVIAETDTSAMPVANQFERMDAAIQNAKVALGEMFGPAVATIAQQIADATIAATAAMKEGAADTSVQRTVATYESLLEQLAKARAELEVFKQVAAETDDITAKMLMNVGTFGAPTDGGDAAQIRETIAALERQILALEGVKVQTAQTRAEAWNAATGWDTFTASVNAAAAAEWRATPAAADLANKLGIVGRLALQAASDVNQFNAAVNRINAGFAIADKLQGVRMGAIASAEAAAQRAVDAGADPGAIAAQLAEVTDQILNMAGPTDATTESMFLFKQQTTGAAGELVGLADGLEEANAAATRAAAGGMKQLDQAYSSLLGKVQGLLSGSLDAGVGVKASDLLPREDEVNENARRLADIAVNGLKGQEWLDEFKAEAPGAWADIMLQVAAGANAQDAAARMLRDFEDGMRTDLLDKGAVKERVKRMILGEQNMAALAEEIAQELATEMGIPLQQAMAAAGATMGVSTGAAGAAAKTADGAAPPDMTGAGSGAAASFLAGFTANADGTIIIAGIVAKMEAQFPRLYSAGASGGTQWGAGFMSVVEDGISTPLINLLATLVTPAVMASFAAATSQTTPP